MLLSLLLATALQSGCADPALASLQPPPVPDTTPAAGSYDPLRGFDPAVDLGIGYLGRKDGADWQWWNHVRLPLFAQPDGQPEAWIVNGWWVSSEGAVRPLGFDGMVETGYEEPSFLLLERRDEGWLRVRVARGDGGVVWTPECWLAQGGGALAFTSWAERLTSSEISPLYFRSVERHPLHAGPDDGDTVIHWIPAPRDSAMIEPVEIRGDWMRVRVTEPSVYCAEDESAAPSPHEGWVRWRGTTGPLLWYYTRGC